MKTTSDVVVVGAGMIGVAVAWRCAERGLTVTLVDPSPQRGAWRTAAGMLAPITESHFTETPLLRLNLAAVARYPEFVAELEDITHGGTGYRQCGTVAVAWDGADLAALRDQQTFLGDLGISADLLSGPDLRRLEPSLASGLPGGLLATHEHHIDPRLLHARMLEAAVMCAVHIVTATAELHTPNGRVLGVTLPDGTHIEAATTVLAAGAWSGIVPAGRLDVPVRPVKGQTLRLHLPSLSLRHIVRGTVKGNSIYVVPREDGRFVVGASSEEAGFDTTPRAGAVYELLRDAQSVLPELSEAALEEVCTGLRPGTPDNAPLVGASTVEGLVLATGHYRNGVLLAPITADGIASLICDGELPGELAPFTPQRFGSVVPA